VVALAEALVFGLAGSVVAEEPLPGGLPKVVEFNRDIRPLLSDNCFACHGPDKNKREADLRLDTQEGLLGAVDQPGVVKPNDPDASELFRRITSSDPDERMPPPDSGKQLSPRTISLIRRWIEQGAPWEGHWAFLPIRRPTPPQIEADGFVQNPIDAFILHTLRAQGLNPSPEADRVTLIRRLSFDLTGLPPTAEEVDAFVNDSDPEAYARLVSRLLNSPHYGERMAVWWLDLVRYADSVGYHGDQPVSISPFRDYVIRAFNHNKPFDQFTIEQLAGDLLPDRTTEQLVASGYNRLGMMSAEGGVQDKEYLAKYIAERVRNASGVWLGTTMGCAECHDHKYDPFTTRDFYQFEAFFADIQERGLYAGAHASGDWGPRIQVPTPEQAQRLAQLDDQIGHLKKVLETPTEELAAAQAPWEQAQPHWHVLRPDSLASTAGATLTLRDDGSIVASGAAPATDTYTLTINNPPPAINALRLEVLPDDSLPQKGPGRAKNGNFVLTEVVAQWQPAGDAPKQSIPLRNASATYEQTGAGEKTPYGKWTAAGAIDGDAQGKTYGWAILEQVGRPQVAVFETAGETRLDGPGTLSLALLQNHDNPGHTLGRFRISVTASPPPLRAAHRLPDNIEAALAVPAQQRTAEQTQAIAAYYRSLSPLLQPARDQLQQLEAARAEFEKRIPTTLVTAAVPPRTIRILPRGNWMDERGEIVTPAVPHFLPPLEATARRLTRLDLARWLVAPDNPLTARALVNRLWKLFFGAGLSRRLDDLGAQGDWPSHPLLLDYLAGDLIDNGWDIKRLVRRIVTSATYRQSSQTSPRLHQIDPQNRYLARQSRFRLDAEFVRDNALAVSGLLVRRIGGPSVFPYQPPGYWAYLNFPTREWQNGTGDELYRRGLYTHWQRQYLQPSLLAFDAPCREECTPDRARSNTPLQSLVLLNDATYVEAARAMAELVLRQGGSSPAERLAWAFRRTLSRLPGPSELRVLEPLLEAHLRHYRENRGAAEQLLSVGARPKPSDLDVAELAAWTSACRVLLNLHETITRN
jgi:hypothetical protein